MNFGIPFSIGTEHNELYAALAQALSRGNETGQAAWAATTILVPHIEKEETYAVPPLALLGPLSRGEETAAMRSVVPLTARLRAEIPAMVNEHREIQRALEKLEQAAKTERHPDIVVIAERFALHVRNEEEILYPAALLVGDYVELKGNRWE